MVQVAKEREREKLYTTRCWSGSNIQYKGWHCWAPWWCRVGISSKAAQNYIETYYLQLKAKQVSLIHTTHPPTSLHPTQPDTLLRIWLEAGYHPFLSVKHINSLSVARKGELILQHMWIKKGKSERWKEKERKRYSTEERKGKGQGKGVERGRDGERDSPEKWGDRKLFTCRKGGQAIFKCLRLLICRAAKPLYTVANVKLVLGTSRSPWPPACLRLEYKCGLRRGYREKIVSTPCTQEFKKAEWWIPSRFMWTKERLGPVYVYVDLDEGQMSELGCSVLFCSVTVQYILGGLNVLSSWWLLY